MSKSINLTLFLFFNKYYLLSKALAVSKNIYQILQNNDIIKEVEKIGREIFDMCNKLEVTPEMLSKLMDAIALNKQKPGPLMPTLHAAQEIFGCIPLEIQKIISKELDISVSTINGVVTFYSRFSTEPKGKHIVGVCLGTACYVRGSQEIIDAVSKELNIGVGETTSDGNFTLEATRCLGACGLAPVFTIDEEVYGNSNKDTAINAIKKYANE